MLRCLVDASHQCPAEEIFPPGCLCQSAWPSKNLQLPFRRSPSHLNHTPRFAFWQCSTYLDDKEWRVSTKTDSLTLAKEFAEDWYLELRGKSRIGQLKTERTYADAAKQFVKEYVTLGYRRWSLACKPIS